MRGLRSWNTRRSDVLTQGEVETVKIGRRSFSRSALSKHAMMSSRTKWLMPGNKGFVIYFIFGSVSPTRLQSIETSIRPSLPRVPGAMRAKLSESRMAPATSPA